MPVLNGLADAELDEHRFSELVMIGRDSIRFEPHEEINPLVTADTQLEEWEWNLFIKGGGGGLDQAAKGAEVDELLETIRTALNAQRPTAQCGPMSILSEEYYEEHGAGVVYLQRWRHSRMAG